MVDYDKMDDASFYVPHHMRGAYQRWIDYGIEPGGFGMAVILGNRDDAVTRADYINQLFVDTQINWVRKHAPPGAYGEDAILDWKGLKRGE